MLMADLERVERSIGAQIAKLKYSAFKGSSRSE